MPRTPTSSTSPRSSAGSSASAGSSSTSAPTASRSTTAPRSAGSSCAARRSSRLALIEPDDALNVDRPGGDTAPTGRSSSSTTRAGSSWPATRSPRPPRPIGGTRSRRGRRPRRPSGTGRLGSTGGSRRSAAVPVDAGTAGLGGAGRDLGRLGRRDPPPPGAVAAPSRGPDRRPAGHARRPRRRAPIDGDRRLSVGQARSTRLDARENAGLSSAEFRASEAAT